MRKFKILGAFIAVLAFSALAVASASAEPVWLKGGVELTKSESATSVGTIILVHEGGTNGKSKVECSGEFEGTVGPKSEDATILVKKGTAEVDLVKCTDKEGFCLSPTAHAVNLTWTTLLKFILSHAWDVFTGRLPIGWEVLCFGGVAVSCTSSEEKASLVAENKVPAEFLYKGKESGESSCNDGGIGYVESPTPGKVEGFSVS